MEIYLLTLSSYEIFLSFFMGLITIIITLVASQKLMLKKSMVQHLLDNNTAIGVFIGALIFSVLIIVIGSVEPAINYLQMKMANAGGKVSFGLLAFTFAQFIVFYLITFFICFLVIGSSLAISFYMTKQLDEVNQIEKGNLSIAVILSFKLIAFSMFIQPATKHFMSSLVNYELTQDEIRNTR